ncbi:glycosyltransferase family 2 protein [Egbenema bharatensis]|uniref:glycosyltransferase family 2 protein n=1 Tax=Egbenema bharatensis TaxID=3463334 RepID=UPI003A8A398C
MPTLSVLMSVYNGSTYLKESIDSILDQTFTDFEFLIIDDCSTDDSWQILQDYADRDGRIRLLQNQENLGLTKSLNRGLAVAEGNYIARQDADDVALPDRFQKQVQVLEQQPEVVLVSCEMEWIDAAGQSLGSMQRSCQADLVPWHLLFYNHVGGHSQVLYRRQAALTAGGYDEARRYSQDYDLWSRLTKQGKIVILPEFLQLQRIHGQAISAQKKTEQEALSLAQTRKNIANLIGEELSEEELRALRGFWIVPVYWYYFGDVVLSREKATMIQTRLRQLYQAFVQQDALTSDSLKREIRQLIRQRYMDWLPHLGFRKHFMLKLQIFIYGLTWLSR